MRCRLQHFWFMSSCAVPTAIAAPGAAGKSPQDLGSEPCVRRGAAALVPAACLWRLHEIRTCAWCFLLVQDGGKGGIWLLLGAFGQAGEGCKCH